MNRITRFLSVLLILVLLVSMTACSSGESPEKAVSSAFQAIKVNDLQTLSKYLDIEQVQNFGESQDPSSKPSEEAFKAMFSKLDAKIISSSVDGNRAIVKAEVTNTNMKAVFGKYITQIFAAAFGQMGPGNSTNAPLTSGDQMLIDLIKGEATTVKSTVDIKLNRVEKSWKIEVDEKLQDAMLGGMLSAVKDLASSFKPPVPEPGSESQNNQLQANALMSEIMDYVASDVWQVLNTISRNIKSGSSNEAAIAQFDGQMQKLNEFNAKAQTMYGPSIEPTLQAWATLYAEIKTLYQTLKQNPPKPGDTEYKFDWELFEQYLNSFTESVKRLS